MYYVKTLDVLRPLENMDSTSWGRLGIWTIISSSNRLVSEKGELAGDFKGRVIGISAKLM
jgi:hypothetical protein